MQQKRRARANSIRIRTVLIDCLLSDVQFETPAERVSARRGLGTAGLVAGFVKPVRNIVVCVP